MLRVFWYPDGTPNPWQSWYEQQNAAVRGKHDTVFRFIEAGIRRPPYVKKLVDADGLSEIIITAGVAHRLLGHWARGSDTFTVVLCCTHKGKQYYPRDALSTAVERCKLSKGGKLAEQLCTKPTPIVRKELRPRK
jgi:hypothetical protein